MIEVSGLSRRFGSVTAVAQVSFQLAAGATAVIRGTSGSGKSTLLHLLCGLLLPDEGEILFDGRLVSQPGFATPPHSRSIGIVFQRRALWPHMSIAQNLTFVMTRGTTAEKRVRAHELLETVRLSHLAARRPDELSGGEAQRAALARALAAHPQRLFLDEPLSNVDRELRLHLLDAILTYCRETAVTLIYITHQDDEAEIINGVQYEMQAGTLQEIKRGGVVLFSAQAVGQQGGQTSGRGASGAAASR